LLFQAKDGGYSYLLAQIHLMNIPQHHKEFIRLVANGTDQDEAYKLTSTNTSLTMATCRVNGSKLAKKYALDIQESKEKASAIVEQANNDKDVQKALKSILTKAEVDAKLCDIIKGELHEVQMLNTQGKIFKALVSPTLSERAKAIDTYYRRFGLNEAQKQEITLNKGFYFDLENDAE
jgi:viroplasmin and RNaseH domain-containing protein